MKPATPLPWTHKLNNSIGNYVEGANGSVLSHSMDIQNASYIVHACNAYPRLVDALRDLTAASTSGLSPEHGARLPEADKVRACRSLLRELGENK